MRDFWLACGHHLTERNADGHLLLTDEFLKAYLPKVPLGRMAEPSDYDGPVVFLMSDASRYMTGSTMVVDGGFSAM